MRLSIQPMLVFMAMTTIALRMKTLYSYISSVPRPGELLPISDYADEGKVSDPITSSEAQTISIINETIHDNSIVQDTADTKPKLIIHVGEYENIAQQIDETRHHRLHSRKSNCVSVFDIGPQKTGSTSIQTLLIKDNKVIEALQKDNYSIFHFGFRDIKTLLHYCFITKTDCGKWDTLLSQLNDTHMKNNSVIWSSEELVNVPMNNFTIPMWRNLLDRWDVQILVFYRPFHKWIYSSYVQDRKSLMYRSGSDKWIEHFGQSDKVKDFPEWLEDHIKSNSKHLRDTMAVKASFEEVYGSNRVHVLDMMAPHGVEIEFLGNDIVNAIQAQEEVKKETQKVWNSALIEVLERMDTDRIIVEAHRQNLANFGAHLGRRNTRRIILEAKLKEWNMTTADLPTVCVSKQQEDWLWNRTLHAQRMLSRYPIPEEELRSHFAVDRKKWCSVDARAMLQNSTWIKYLSNCPFKLRC